MQMKLEMITKWLKDSGLVVNESKTEICLFHRNDNQVITLILQNQRIVSKTSMNVLGVVFDSKLTWSNQVSNAITKANKSLCALRLLKRYFLPHEMKLLLTSNYFSSLYYNSEIWLSPLLKSDSKQLLLSASANALRSCMPLKNRFISFEDIHKNFGQPTPMSIGLYKLSLLLYKTFNSKDLNNDWLDLSEQIIVTGRQNRFSCFKNNNYKIGMNKQSNKFFFLKNRIDLDLFDLSLPVFKIMMKKEFM